MLAWPAQVPLLEAGLLVGLGDVLLVSEFPNPGIVPAAEFEFSRSFLNEVINK